VIEINEEELTIEPNKEEIKKKEDIAMKNGKFK
jgi:hypothetical protein